MIFWYELKKILSMAVIWGFVALCVVFNIWQMPTGLNRDLDTTTRFSENVFAGLDTSDIAQSYLLFFGLEGRVAERMRAKFDALQAPVGERALSGDSYTPYFGEHTYKMHLSLFHSLGVLGILLLQGILAAVLIALLSVGYEQANHTEPSVYATKTGRHLVSYKITASVVSAIVLYAMLVAVTLFVYFRLFDFSDVWGSSVSSGFNAMNSIVDRPFTTWRGFTVATYLWASLGVSVGIVVCFSLMGAAIGLLAKNSYVGFLAVLFLNACLIVTPLMIPRHFYAHFIALHSPVYLWLNSGLWFTDGSLITLWRHFELWGLGISLGILAGCCILAVKKFEERNIV